MKDPHIYLGEDSIKCSICGNSETLNGEKLKHFKLKVFSDINIVNSTKDNFHPDYCITCFQCDKQTKVCAPPYLYY